MNAALSFLLFGVLVAICILALSWRADILRWRGWFKLQRSVTCVLEPSFSAAEAVPQLLPVLCRELRASAACVFVLDDQLGMRCLSAYAAVPRAEEFAQVSSNLLYASGTGLSGILQQKQSVVELTEFEGEQHFARIAAGTRAGLKKILLVPVLDQNNLIASIEVYFDRYDIHREVAEQLGIVGSRLSLLMWREKAQHQIASSEHELRAVIDTAPDGIIYVDKEGRIVSVNAAAANLVGYERAELIGRYIYDFLPEIYKERSGSALKYYFETVVSGLVGRATEVIGQHRDGSIFPIELTVGRLKVEEREIFTGIIRDISDRKLMEKRVSEFYSMVSHELRSPLSSIRGSLGLIEGGAMGEVAPDVLELVQIAKKNCDRLIRLVNDILDAKKIEAGKLFIARDILDPDELIHAAVEVLQSFAAESKVALVVQSGHRKQVIGDSDRIVQVLTNLLSNAIKYSFEGSQVDVYTSAALNGDHFVRFCVRDCGPGIQSDQLAKLFSEFQQIDSSDSRSKGGTGLGLAISKSIVDQLGGQIGVDNRPGEGATFWFELPAAEESAL